MPYDVDLWNKYTEDNEHDFNEELPKFIYHISLALNTSSVLEVGCNVGNNLLGFPESSNVNGIDLNEYSLIKAKAKHPKFNFKKGTISDIPFGNSSMDLVFTRGVLIHIPEENLNKAMSELLRVSKRWIFNLEYFNEEEKEIDWKRGMGLLWYRNMQKRWKSFDVEIITDINIPLEIDPGKMKLTLVKKDYN